MLGLAAVYIYITEFLEVDEYEHIKAFARFDWHVNLVAHWGCHLSITFEWNGTNTQFIQINLNAAYVA